MPLWAVSWGSSLGYYLSWWLTGGSYGLTGTDIFTFIIMSIIGITLAGAIVGVVFGALVWTISSAVSRVRRPS